MRNRFEESENSIDTILEWGIKGILGTVFVGIALWEVCGISQTIFWIIWKIIPWACAGALMCGGWQWAKKNLF